MRQVLSRQALTLLELLVVLAIIAVAIGLVLPAVQRIRATAARASCQNKLKQIGLAVHLYEGSHRRLPPGLSVEVDQRRYAYLGWTGRILPFMEQQGLWTMVESAFATDPNPLEFYGQDAHAPVLESMVKGYVCPSDYRGSEIASFGKNRYAHTSYLGVAGIDYRRRDGVFFVDSLISIHDIRDGASNTLMIGERPPPPDSAFGWWYRGWGQNKDGSAEMLVGVRELNTLEGRYKCPPGPYSFRFGRMDDQCDMFHFWSVHSGGANFAFADGSVRFMDYSADRIIAELATRNGGESPEIP